MQVNKLHDGDTIGIICPSFKGDMTSSRIAKLEEELHKLGFKVKYGASCYDAHGYLAGTDENRIKDLEAMFLDHEVKAIMCLKGGYGASRIVDKINYDVIKNNPKLFMGFSDITVLLNAFYQKAGLPCIHGLVGIFLGHPRIDEDSLNDFCLLLKENTKDRILKNPHNDAITIHEGQAIGPLVGGNLSLITNLIGTPYDIDFKDRIVFIEEVDEDPYRIDRMFSQLRLSGKLQDAKGFVFGHFTDCVSKDKPHSQTYDDLIDEYFRDLPIPMMKNFNCGHDFPFINLPIGLKAKLDTKQKEIKILEEIYKA
jgi:muramoyltetrapeptide carboxypeptidase